MFCSFTRHLLNTSKMCALVQTGSVFTSSMNQLEFFDRRFQIKDTWSKRQQKRREEADKRDKKAMVKQGYVFDDLPPETKTKEAFETAIGLFTKRNIHLRGHCEFIYAALKRMKDFGVHEDLEVYKRLVDLFPKGKMVSKNIYQAEYHFYPKQQQCCKDVLQQMLYHNVCPDKEFNDLVVSRFGQWSHASRKMKHLMYWLPKFKYANPYPYPRPLPKSDIELAKIAMQRMCRDPGNVISVWFTESLPDAPEDTWIVNGQSLSQKDHIKEHKKTEPLYVDGPFRVWVHDKHVQYFMLSSEPNREKYYGFYKSSEKHTEEEWAQWESKYNSEFPHSRRQLMLTPTIHEQPEGTILALAISGTNSKESMTCWINFLQVENPKLSEVAIVFRIRDLSGGEVMTVDEATRVKCSANMVEQPSS